MISRGDVYWLSLRGAGSAPSGRRPVVVVQHDRYNRSALNTTIVAAITSNVERGGMAGNVRLARGEAGLSKVSVVNITQLVTVEKAALTERIGALSAAKRDELVDSLALILGPDRVTH